MHLTRSSLLQAGALTLWCEQSFFREDGTASLVLGISSCEEDLSARKHQNEALEGVLIPVVDRGDEGIARCM